MRLSEAIRLGSLAIQNPQKCDSRFCAIGMGVEAIGQRDMDSDEANYVNLVNAWPWTKVEVLGDPYYCQLYILFDQKVMRDEMTVEQLCDQVSIWERDLAAKGINVEQVTMIATPEATHEPVAERTKVLCD